MISRSEEPEAQLDLERPTCDALTMRMRSNLFLYPITAVAAAIYWYAAAWFCFVVTGHDPLDALTGTVTNERRLSVVAIVSAFVMMLAIVNRRWQLA